jgi:two-component system alkaline phosphatase synthesis response regulator PhoP
MGATKVLVVEDEPGIAFALEADLAAEGYEVTAVNDGLQGLAKARTGEFEVILLDVMLPGRDGFDVCRDLRRAGVKSGIILLTAKSSEAEKVMGLELGADDYVTKPYSARELRARVKALLRRKGETVEEVMRFGSFELDLARFELRHEGKAVETTPTELKVLAKFLRNRGRVLTREALLEDVWGETKYVTDRVVDNVIVSLRKKIEPTPSSPQYLVSVRSVGYRFDG